MEADLASEKLGVFSVIWWAELNVLVTATVGTFFKESIGLVVVWISKQGRLTSTS
jgi:hypothetical protein